MKKNPGKNDLHQKKIKQINTEILISPRCIVSTAPKSQRNFNDYAQRNTATFDSP